MRLLKKLVKEMSDETNNNTDQNQIENSEATSEIVSTDEKLLASLIAENQAKFIKTNENIIVSNFVGFFEPLIKNLDLNVQNLRYYIEIFKSLNLYRYKV